MTTDIEQQTLAIVNSHMEAVSGDSVDEVMKFYSDDTVLITHDGVFRTPEEIRRYYDHFIKNRPPGANKTFKLLQQKIAGEAVYIVWRAEPYVHWATDTFVVRNGKIVLHTYCPYMPVGNALAKVAKAFGLEK